MQGSPRGRGSPGPGWLGQGPEQDRAGQGAGHPGVGAVVGRVRLTPLGLPQALLQVHALELQDVQLLLDLLHLPLDLLLGHVVGVQLQAKGW